MTRAVPDAIVVRAGGGSSSAGILLLLVGVVGLLALFTGNLERLLEAVAGPAGGAKGIYTRSVREPSSSIGTPAVSTGQYGQPVAGTPVPSAGQVRS